MDSPASNSFLYRVLSCTEQCCYRTSYLNKDMAYAQTASYNAIPKALLAGHPWAVVWVVDIAHESVYCSNDTWLHLVNKNVQLWSCVAISPFLYYCPLFWAMISAHVASLFLLNTFLYGECIDCSYSCYCLAIVEFDWKLLSLFRVLGGVILLSCL